MKPPIKTRKGVTISLLVAAVLFASLSVAGTALATPVTFNLNYTTGDAATAVGTFSVDSSLLVPNVIIESEDGLGDLLCFNLTVTIPTGLTLTFTKVDLDGWAFVTDAGGNFTDVNFFMDSARCASRTFRINGEAPLVLRLFDCSFGPVAEFQAHPEQGGVCEGAMGVPALSLSGLVALLMLVGIAAVLVLRRGTGLG